MLTYKPLWYHIKAVLLYSHKRFAVDCKAHFL
nr:MAG TPA: hypothetical protein [Caudoviricetes sp.]